MSIIWDTDGNRYVVFDDGTKVKIGTVRIKREEKSC